MFNDEFKSRYTTIPFATFCRNHQKDALDHDDTSIMHNHKEIELIAVLEGKGVIHLDNLSYPIKKGDVIIIPPYTLHCATAFTEDALMHYCLSFDMSLIPDPNLQENMEKGFIITQKIICAENKNASDLSQLIKNAFDAHQRQEDGWELKVVGNMSVFFGLLKEHKFIQSVQYTNTNHICRDIMDYIANNYSENITSSSAAHKFNVSKSYFCRIFKQNFGQCFQNYINMYRVEKSKTLLKTTDLPVSQVALAVGFNSFSFFSKIFKEYMGITPSKYRKTD